LAPSSSSIPWKKLAASAGILLAALTAFAGWRYYRHAAQVRWVEQTAAPQIAQLIEHDRMLAAAALYREAERITPESKSLYKLAEGVASHSATFETVPSGADIYIQDYSAAPSDDLSQWRSLGKSPATISSLPKAGYYRVRAVKDGYAPIDLSMDANTPLIRLPLRKATDVPEGAVWIDPAGSQPGFWLDRFEVTNEQFQKFVEAGGYHRPEFWKQPFISKGKELHFDEAMRLFRDQSGRPGPSTWNLAQFPDDTRSLPVTGLSWYEAAAYAEFVGKALPTFDEWHRATQIGYYSHIVPVSNFSGKALAPVGAYRGPVPAGAYDLAGNAKEWIFTATDERRYILGGAWDEPSYNFNALDARDPFSRAANFGFRCVLRPQALPANAFAPVAMPYPKPMKAPVDDRIYNIYVGLHAYTKSPLDSRLEHTDNTPAHWRSETVSFRAAYSQDRVIAHVFLPKSGKPPFQVVMVMGGVSIMDWKRIEDFGLPYEFLARAGRAVVIPAYAGTLERGPSPYVLPVNEERDRAIKWFMDLGRSLDYLETRNDVDTSKLAFYGISSGGSHGARFLALEPRLKTGILVSAGVFPGGPDETNAWNFAPRVHSPVLMLGGRYDFVQSEASQKLLFHALGTKEPDKRFVQFEGGHINLVTRPDLLGEILNWLDHYLGPTSN
jgi:dienelactone hydrolase